MACDPGYIIDHDKCISVSDDMCPNGGKASAHNGKLVCTQCKLNEYFFNGKCKSCQAGGKCDGSILKCTYGYIMSNGVMTCDSAPGINQSCPYFVEKNHKCATEKELCPSGKVIKAE